MTAEDQTRLRGACFCLWLAGRYRDPVRLAVRFGLDVEAVRQWRAAFSAQYAPVRAHMKAFDLRLLGRLPAWERCELTRRVLAERERRMQRERRLRPARIRAGLAVLEGWRKRKVNRPRCGARCRDGHACRAPVVLRVDGTLAKRCRMHGGLSTGARSPAGQARALAALQAGIARWRARRKEFPDTNAHAHALVVDFDDA